MSPNINPVKWINSDIFVFNVMADKKVTIAKNVKICIESV